MGLRSLLKRVTDKFSGEYSAAQSDIRPDDGRRDDPSTTATVTRARLKRPKDAKEESADQEAERPAAGPRPGGGSHEVGGTEGAGG